MKYFNIHTVLHFSITLFLANNRRRIITFVNEPSRRSLDRLPRRRCFFLFPMTLTITLTITITSTFTSLPFRNLISLLQYLGRCIENAHRGLLAHGALVGFLMVI
jgi:hypothetical protein